ncbi:helix-turn-helix domain-containing protein [Nonomuraea sp. NPDC049709]|uniref:helix-turn-helix domain-containing protein n=1 Tax=Nonomuraea sp. NPDC049709 TaxID=3154736 RepID=UPI003429B044
MPGPQLDPEEVYLTTAQAAELAGVSEAAIGQWVRRKHLAPAGRDRRGAMMFTQRAVAHARRRPAEVLAREIVAALEAAARDSRTRRRAKVKQTAGFLGGSGWLVPFGVAGSAASAVIGL